MVLSYVQLLLVCFSFWSSKEAVARARRRQWAEALSFVGIVLLCLLIPKSGWFLLALVDGALLILAYSTERSIHSHTAHPPKPISWQESNWHTCVLMLISITFLEALIWRAGLGTLAAPLMTWLPLIVLTGGVSAFFVTDTPEVVSAALLGLKTKSMAFYEGSDTGPAVLGPKSANYFPHKALGFIWFVANMEANKWREWRAWNCPFVYRYYTPDGSLLAEGQKEVLLQPYEARVHIRGSSGCVIWTPGTYCVEILLSGDVVSKGSFTIEPLPPPPPLTLTEMVQPASVRFYASRTRDGARQFSVRFPHQSTREVVCEFTVRNLLYGHGDRTYRVTAQCYQPDGRLLWDGHQDWLIKADEQEPSISWGWQAPGQWEAGAYRVEISIDGVDFAWGAFLIE